MKTFTALPHLIARPQTPGLDPPLHKSNHLAKAGGEKCYLSKESSRRDLVSEQDQTFFTFAIL